VAVDGMFFVVVRATPAMAIEELGLDAHIVDKR